MHPRRVVRLVLAGLTAVLLTLGLLTPVAMPASAHPGHGEHRFRVLVFSKVTNFYHDSIPAGIATIQQLGVEHDFDVVATDDAAAFTDDNLATFDALVFNNTNSTPESGDLLNADQRAALQRYIQAGGGYVGVHAASASERSWTWYEGLVGAIFENHPAIQPGRVKMLDRVHPSTKGLPELWEHTEEWYNWRTNPYGKVHTLAEIKTNDGITGLNEGVDHPISWCQKYDGGRSWFTGMGHAAETFSAAEFRTHLLGGIEWAAGAVEGECGATQRSNFDKVPLVTADLADPFELAITPDRRVIYIQRTGQVKVLNQDTLELTTALDFDYSLEMTSQSDGLIGLTIDSGFATNHWIYLFWSDKVEKRINLSRYTLGDDNVIDPASEKRLLTVPTWRGEGRANSHMGGSIAFGPTGDLYVAVGDNTDPFQSQGFSPIDEREGRRAYDAQGTSGNTNDLRGKILRIHPEADGTYTIPAGNLFAPGTEKTLPEIYAMGFRNPFRITVDPKDGALLVGDYGPDSRTADPARGPAGLVEWGRLTAAGNHGWPYCVGENTPYRDYDFATGTSGPAFDCAGGPVNDSPNNTGLQKLPPAKPALVTYGYPASPDFPELGSGGAGPMGGPVYDYDPALNRKTKFPEYYDGQWFVYELTRNYFKTLSLHQQDLTFDDPRFDPVKKGDLFSINPFLSDKKFIQPFDAEFGPDGSLYLIEFGAGSGAGRGGTNDGAGIYRVDYVANGRPPVAKLSVTPDSGPAPLTVQFSSEGSGSPSNLDVTYAWDFDGNGTVDSTDPNPSHVYTAVGQFNARLTVTDSDGETAVAVQKVTAGNTRPEIRYRNPANGGMFEFGDQVPYGVDVTDAEDGSTAAGTIDCTRVTVSSQLGHDVHAHPLDNYTGCSNVVTTDAADHGAGQNIYWVLAGSYVDKGAPGTPELAGQVRAELQPRDKEAEHFDSSEGVQIVDRAGSRGGRRVEGIDPGDWIAFSPMDLAGIDSLTLGAGGGTAGGSVEVRRDRPDGPLVGTVNVPASGSLDAVVSPTIDIDGAGGSTTLYLVFRGTGTGLMALDWLTFHGRGAANDVAPAVTATATPASGQAPAVVSFDGSAVAPSGRTIAKYHWDFGDGTTAEGQQASHTYQWGGPFTARLVVTDSAGTHDWMTVAVNITPPPPCDPTPPALADEFDGQLLERCRWTRTVRPNPTDYRVAGGFLEIDTTHGGHYGANNLPPAENQILQPAPAGDWVMETKVVAPVAQRYQQAGLILYADDANYVKFDLVADNAPGSARIRRFEFRSEIGDAPQNPQPNAAVATDAGETWWLRLGRRGNTFSAWYSTDGVQWTAMGGSVTNDKLATAGVGVFTNGRGQTSQATMKFDYFRQFVDTVAPVVSASVTPATPDGANGWWTSPVTVAATADDPSARLESKVGDGAWTPYTAPVAISADGVHTVAFRGTDDAGNVSAEKPVTVKLDATAPTVALGGVDDGASYGDSAVRAITFGGTDPVSGVASVVATLDGAALAPGALSLDRLTLGAHELVVTVRDQAGHTASRTAGFTVTTSSADVAVLLDRYATSGQVSRQGDKALSTHLTEYRTWAGRDDQRAADALQRFHDAAGRTVFVPDAQARTALQRDALALRAALG